MLLMKIILNYCVIYRDVNGPVQSGLGPVRLQNFITVTVQFLEVRTVTGPYPSVKYRSETGPGPVPDRTDN